MKRNNLRERACKGLFQVSSYFETNPDLKLMIEPFPWDFRDKYREAFDLYKNGYWVKAAQLFRESTKILKDKSPDLKDTLAEIHLDYMKEHDFESPPDWCGHKHFDE